MKKPILFLLFLFLFLTSESFALVVVNSFDGRDVVSAVYYAALLGEKAVFVSPSSDEQIVYNKIGTDQNVLLVESANFSVLTALKNTLENRGNKVELFVSYDPYATNLELAERSAAKKFVLVDPVYGYSAVSVLPYAKINRMYLIFANEQNGESVVGFIKSKNAEDILVYGPVHPKLKDALTKNNIRFREINTGDKFDDNLALLDLYFKEEPSHRQVVLSDGNAFEDKTASADDPAILISPIIPSATYDYIKEKVSTGQIKVALVVDSEYAQTAYNLKESINKELGAKLLYVLVQTGQSAGGGGMVPVDFFPLPGPVLGLEMEGVNYNQKSKNIEVTYKNTGNAREHVRAQLFVFGDGNYLGTVGDSAPFEIESGEILGVAYPFEIKEGEAVVNITVLYGTSKKYMESGFQRIVPIGAIAFFDRSSLDISRIGEDTKTSDLTVVFTNNGTTPLYFKPDALVEANGSSTKVKSASVYRLEPGEVQLVTFFGIAKPGAVITVGANYGEREAFLEKRITKKYGVGSSETGYFSDFNIILYLLVILLVAFVAYLVSKKK